MKLILLIRKRLLALAILLYALLLVSCHNNDESSKLMEKTITFNLRTIDLTLSRSTIGEGYENGSFGDWLAFYQFDSNGHYERRYLMAQSDFDSQDVQQKVNTYVVKMDSESTGEKHFVVVEAPDIALLPEPAAGTMLDALLHVTTVNNGLLLPPFIMSSVTDEGLGYVTINDVALPDNKINVDLVRRVARFDIENDPLASGIVIDKVYVKNRRTKGYVGNVKGYPADVTTNMLEIDAAELTNGGKSFYLYPTLLTADSEQEEKTAIWATTKLFKEGIAGPMLRLNLTDDIEIQANHLYRLDTKKIGGEGYFDISVKDWEDGTSSDWFAIEDCILLPDDNAQIFKGTQIKGNYVKIGSNVTIPYRIVRIISDTQPEDKVVDCDGILPKWLTIESTTAVAGGGYYRHEIVYTINRMPQNTQFAITYLGDRVADEDMLNIGFLDPYPETPLPCLSYGNYLYSPIHMNQTTYLTHNQTDKAYYAGVTAYTLYQVMDGIVNNEVVDPSPEGWTVLDNEQAENYISRVSTNLVSAMDNGYVYTYKWVENEDESTQMRILAGYPNKNKPTLKDLACFGTWPYVAWAEIRLSDMTVTNSTYGTSWKVTSNYGIPYRCIRAKDIDLNTKTE